MEEDEIREGILELEEDGVWRNPGKEVRTLVIRGGKLECKEVEEKDQENEMREDPHVQEMGGIPDEEEEGRVKTGKKLSELFKVELEEGRVKTVEKLSELESVWSRMLSKRVKEIGLDMSGSWISRSRRTQEIKSQGQGKLTDLGIQEKVEDQGIFLRRDTMWPGGEGHTS
jgi:hypothetical protein